MATLPFSKLINGYAQVHFRKTYGFTSIADFYLRIVMYNSSSWSDTSLKIGPTVERIGNAD
jgi:hypothetical protein